MNPEFVWHTILSVSGASAVLIAGTALLQFALRKRLSAAWRFALWLPVLLRLLVPALPESSWSLFNARRWLAPPTRTSCSCLLVSNLKS